MPAEATPEEMRELENLNKDIEQITGDILGMMGAEDAERPGVAPAEAGEGEDLLSKPEPEQVQEATTILVEAGLLDRVTAEVTPEVQKVLMTLAEQNYPGLLDVAGNPQHLKSVIEGVIDGSVELNPGAAGDLPAGVPEGPSGAVGDPTGLAGPVGAAPGGPGAGAADIAALLGAGGPGPGPV